MKLSNVVYTSAALSRYPKVQDTIREAVVKHGLQYREIEGTKNIWCRDWMPVPGRNGLVKFGYKGYPGANYDQYPQLAVPDECWNDLALPVELATAFHLDGGGNCVRSEHTAVVTDVVYEHNRHTHPEHVRKFLERSLGMDVLVIPREPGDELGHSDGIVKFIGNDAAFVNECFDGDLREKAHANAVADLLEQHGITPIRFPFGYGREGFPTITEEEFRQRFPDGDDFNDAVGYYINFLHVEGLVLLPSFNHPMDDEAARKVEEYIDADVVQIDCSELAHEGGLVNCVTWDLRE